MHNPTVARASLSGPFCPISSGGSLQKGHGAFPAQSSSCCKPSTYLQALPSLHADPQWQPSASGEPGTAL